MDSNARTWSIKKLRDNYPWLTRNYLDMHSTMKLNWACCLVDHICNGNLNLESANDLEFISDLINRLDRGRCPSNILDTNIWDIILDYGAQVYDLTECKTRLMKDIIRLTNNQEVTI